MMMEIFFCLSAFVLSIVVYHLAMFSTKEIPFEEVLAKQRQKRNLDILPTKADKAQKKPKPKKVKPKKEESHLSQSQVKSGKDSLAPVHQPIAIKAKDGSPKSPKVATLPVGTQEGVNPAASTQVQSQQKSSPVAPQGQKSELPKEKREKNKKGKEESKELKIDETAKEATKGKKEKGKKKEEKADQSPPARKQTEVVSKVEKSSAKVQQQSQAPHPVGGDPPTKKSPSVAEAAKRKVVPVPSPKKAAPQPGDNSSNLKEEKAKASQSSAVVSNLMKDQMDLIAFQINSSNDKKKKEKEDRKRIISISDDALSRLLPIIQKTQLSGGEIQMLIETLLNKQQLTGGPGGEWVEKGGKDPVTQMKRQLEDAESRIKEQTDAQQALSAKIADLRADLNTERGKSSSLKKQLDGSGTLLQQRLDAAAATHKDELNAKLREMKVTVSKEYQAAMQNHQTSKAELELQLKSLQTSQAEVEKQLQEAAKQGDAETQYQLAQSSLSEAQLQLQLQSSEKVREDLSNRCQELQQRLASLEEQETAFNARLAEAHQKLSASESAQSQVASQLAHVSHENDLMHQQRELLSQSQVKLKNLILEKTELETRLTQTEKDLACHRESLSKQRTEIECLKEEKESLASQSVRPAAEGQENGDHHVEQKQSIADEDLSERHEQQISVLTKEVSRLKEESCRLRRKTEEETERCNNVSKDSRDVLLRIYPSLQKSAHLEHGAFLKEAEAEAASVAAKLQTPVVKVKTETVEKVVEKIVQDPKLVQELEEVKKENADLHLKVEQFKEEKLSLQNSLKSSSNKHQHITTLIAQLEIENKTLAEKIVHYQDILANTESLLTTLQKSVENEESTWHDKILAKEEEVRQLVVEKKNLALRVSELQSSLDKVKQAEEMESQLNFLKEKLVQEEADKGKIQEQLIKVQDQLKSANVVQVSTNGPANGVDCHEDEISQADTASLVSSEGHSADDPNKKKKKKKTVNASMAE